MLNPTISSKLLLFFLAKYNIKSDRSGIDNIILKRWVLWQTIYFFKDFLLSVTVVVASGYASSLALSIAFPETSDDP